MLAWAQLLTNVSLDPSSYHHSLLIPQHVHIFSYTPDITSMCVAGGGGLEEIPREYLLMSHCPELYNMTNTSKTGDMSISLYLEVGIVLS